MSKSSGSTQYIPALSPQQNAQIAAQTNFFLKNIVPTFKAGVSGATDVYNRYGTGVNAAAQNQAGIARQVQDVTGSTGESALRTGITGLENLFSPNYERTQIQSALMPAQAQFMQNLTAQNAQFGGAGNLGSARQALAGRQLAGATQAAQFQAAAGIQQQIAAQRAAAASQLANLGQAGLGQSLGAAGNAVSAANIPMQTYGQYLSQVYGTPQGSYTPDFRGTQGGTTNKTGYEIGFKGISLPGMG